MRSVARIVTGFVALLLLAACSHNHSSGPPGPYADEASWLCKPGASSNRCLELDQTLTNVYSTASSAVIEHTPAADPKFDCFYVYPTANDGEEPGNVEDPSVDDEAILRVLYLQAARFTELCGMYAPLYRQMTIPAYHLGGDYRDNEFFDRAYGDVDEAFQQYLLESDGRPFVLMGHSQGAHMVMELLRQRFENNPTMRKRLISSLIIGPFDELRVPAGETSGGTFENIPLCTDATDTSCIIAYDSIAAGGEDERELVAEPRPCVDPTRLGGSPGIVENMIMDIVSGFPFPEKVETRALGFPLVYTARCERDGFLAIDVVNDEERAPPFTPQLVQKMLGGSLHDTDFNFMMGDLLRIVATQAENLP
jgi:hypothetical protein